MSVICIDVGVPGPKNAELTCNWCGLPHKVEQAYRDDVLARAAERLADVKKRSDDPLVQALTPDATWTCGKCIIVLMGLPARMSTDCHEHVVPKERVTLS